MKRAMPKWRPAPDALVRSFEPMPGRPMREYVVLPRHIVDSPGELRAWLGKARAYAAALPPKARARKTKSARNTKTSKTPKTSNRTSAPAAMPRGLPRGISDRSRWGWGPSASEKKKTR